MKSDQLCSSLYESLSPLFECVRTPSGDVRVRTPFMYPDGGIIDIFVLERDGGYRLTDFGESLGWLRMQSGSAKRSGKQNSLIKDTCQTHGIELNRGQLEIPSVTDHDLGPAVARLAGAAVRVTDFVVYVAAAGW